MRKLAKLTKLTSVCEVEGLDGVPPPAIRPCPFEVK